MRIFVTGGTGYIGSHTCVRLLERGHEVHIIDNLSRSGRRVLDQIETITGRAPAFSEVDLTDAEAVQRQLEENTPDAVIHFAALAEVGESVRNPLLYYRNNVTGSVNLFDACRTCGVTDVVFSSSCTVYGEPDVVPVKEDAELEPGNPYGRTKLCVENLLSDLHRSSEDWDIMVLRYFNPVAVHPSGLLGNNSVDPPMKLMPNLLEVAAGEQEEFSIFGDDYPTEDGTPVRDYIHIMDLVDGHLAALEKMEQEDGYHVYNLGTGTGYSVLEVIETFQNVTGQEVPYRIEDRRPGDAARVYADPSKANDELNWSAKRNLADMCKDAWRGKKNRIGAD